MDGVSDGKVSESYILTSLLEGVTRLLLPRTLANFPFLSLLGSEAKKR